MHLLYGTMLSGHSVAPILAVAEEQIVLVAAQKPRGFPELLGHGQFWPRDTVRPERHQLLADLDHVVEHVKRRRNVSDSKFGAQATQRDLAVLGSILVQVVALVELRIVDQLVQEFDVTRLD